MSLKEILESKENYKCLGKINEEEIKDAEKKLGIKFSKEYYELIKECGVVVFDGHEFMGICNSKRLNVVDTTLTEREYNTNLSTDMYLIENVGIDGILIFQKEDGSVYSTQNNSKPKKICGSLKEYVNSFCK